MTWLISYWSNDNTPWFSWFAWASIAVAACWRILSFENYVIASTISTSLIFDSAGCKFSAKFYNFVKYLICKIENIWSDVSKRPRIQINCNNILIPPFKIFCVYSIDRLVHSQLFTRNIPLIFNRNSRIIILFILK